MQVFDKAGMTEEEVKEIENQGKEGGDDAKDKKNKEDIEAGSQPEGESGSDGGGADNPDGQDAGAEEGEDGKEKGGVDAEALEASLLDKVKDLIPSLIPKPDEKQEPTELSDQEKEKMAQELGVPFSAIDHYTKQNALVVEKVKEMLDTELADFRKDNAVTRLSQDPKFSDAMKYKKEINEFLGNFPKKFHGDEKILKMAVMYGRGVNLKSEVHKARNDGERNRKIAGPGRPAAPTSGARKPAPKPLTEMQKQAARAGGMSDDEYRKHLGGPLIVDS